MSMPGMPTILKCIRCHSDVKKKEVILGNAEGVDDETCICPECLPRWKELQATRHGQPSVSEDENFVALIQAASEDKEIKATIRNLAVLDSFNRESLLNTMLAQMAAHGAPKELIKALPFLKDDDIAHEILEVLK